MPDWPNPNKKTYSTRQLKVMDKVFSEIPPSSVTISTVIKGVLFTTEPMTGEEAMSKFLRYKPKERLQMVNNLVKSVELGLTNQVLTLTFNKGGRLITRSHKQVVIQEQEEVEEEGTPTGFTSGVNPLTGLELSGDALKEFIAYHPQWGNDCISLGEEEANKRLIKKESKPIAKIKGDGLTEYGKKTKYKPFVPKKFVPLSQEEIDAFHAKNKEK